MSKPRIESLEPGHYLVMCREDSEPDGTPGRYTLATSRTFDALGAEKYADSIAPSREAAILFIAAVRHPEGNVGRRVTGGPDPKEWIAARKAELKQTIRELEMTQGEWEAEYGRWPGIGYRLTLTAQRKRLEEDIARAEANLD